MNQTFQTLQTIFENPTNVFFCFYLSLWICFWGEFVIYYVWHWGNLDFILKGIRLFHFPLKNVNIDVLFWWTWWEWHFSFLTSWEPNSVHCSVHLVRREWEWNFAEEFLRKLLRYFFGVFRKLLRYFFGVLRKLLRCFEFFAARYWYVLVFLLQDIEMFWVFCCKILTCFEFFAARYWDVLSFFAAKYWYVLSFLRKLLRYFFGVLRKLLRSFRCFSARYWDVLSVLLQYIEIFWMFCCKILRCFEYFAASYWDVFFGAEMPTSMEKALKVKS